MPGTPASRLNTVGPKSPVSPKSPPIEKFTPNGVCREPCEVPNDRLEQQSSGLPLAMISAEPPRRDPGDRAGTVQFDPRVAVNVQRQPVGRIAGWERRQDGQIPRLSVHDGKRPSFVVDGGEGAP